MTNALLKGLFAGEPAPTQKGLLGDVLPWVYSKGNALRGLLSNPVESAQNAVADANTRAGGLLSLHREATNEGMAYGPKTNALAGLLADSYNPIGMTVWHGSPHSFGKFDASKIGSGEGNQSFGHGLYFAENPGVAKSYAETLSTPSGPAADVAKYWRANGGESAFRAFAKDAGLDERTVSEVANFIRSSGNLYKVDLPDSAIPKMLDWDKGGQQMWESAVKQHGTPQAAASALRSQGYTGIRYLDGGSRSNGQGTSNYVVFPGNEGLLSILERTTP